MAPFPASLAVALSVCTCLCSALFLPATPPATVLHDLNGTMTARVGSLSSPRGPSFSYYHLPFCAPEEGVQRTSPSNFAEALAGSVVETSPYKFRALRTQHAVKVCDSGPLSQDDVARFRRMIDDEYRVELLLDGLPVTTYALEDNPGNVRTGFPVGYKRRPRGRRGMPVEYQSKNSSSSEEREYLVYNHLILKVLVHSHEGGHHPDGDVPGGTILRVLQGVSRRVRSLLGGGSQRDREPQVGAGGLSSSGYVVVGFEAAACSIARDAEPKVPRYTKLQARDCIQSSPQAIKAGSKIVYTMDVLWQDSPTPWARRWDAYLQSSGNEARWLSLLNSLQVVGFLTWFLFAQIKQMLNSGLEASLACPASKEKGTTSSRSEAASAQKGATEGDTETVGILPGAPQSPELLCTLVASGVQISCTAVASATFAAMGFTSPAAPGSFLMALVLLYVFFGLVAGYVGGRLWVMITGRAEAAATLGLKIVLFFPGACALVLAAVNVLLHEAGSSSALPFSLFAILFALWAMICLPLTVAGAHLGMKASRVQFLPCNNQGQRQAPNVPGSKPQRIPGWLLLVGGGVLPFSALYVELFCIMSAIWFHHIYYYNFTSLFPIMILLIVICAEVGLWITYLQIKTRRNPHCWWWSSFFVSGSSALYLVLFCIKFFVVDLQGMSGPLPAAIFVAYSLLMVLGLFLATGSISFISSVLFVRCLVTPSCAKLGSPLNLSSAPGLESPLISEAAA